MWDLSHAQTLVSTTFCAVRLS